MSDPETRSRRAEKMKRKRNPVAKEMLQRGKQYSEKMIDPRKEEYKRMKLDPRNIRNFEEE